MAVLDDITGFLQGAGIWPAVQFLGIVVLGFFAAQLSALLVGRSAIKYVPAEMVAPFRKATFYLVLSVFVITALAFLEVDLTGFLVVGGILGIALGFAAQSTVANLISGLFLRIDRPFRTGDWVEVGEVSGRIIQIRVFSTAIKTFTGLRIRIPNEKMFTAVIVNHYAHRIVRIDVVAGIEYRDDQDRAIELLTTSLERHPQVLHSPPPRVFLEKLNTSSVDLQVRAWVPARRWLEMRTEIHNLIKHTVEDNGMTIAFPQQVNWSAE